MSTTSKSWLSRQLLKNERVIFFQSILSILVIWQIFAIGLGMVDTISSPLIVGEEMYSLLISMEWPEHVIATSRRILYGFILTIVAGTFIGVLMGLSKFWQLALQDYITATLALPSLFAAVFAAMWFGISDVTPMVAGAVIAFPFMTQNVYEGVNAVDNNLFDMSSAFDVSRGRVLKRVLLQSVLPEWFAGARYSFAVCWKITTLAEVIAATNGIGFMIHFHLNNLSLSGILAWTFMFTFIILAVEYGIFQQIEHRVFKWRKSTSLSWAT
jgi:ABC-type nitrate/sulfonate/bicarbonate transport system permease component